LDRRPVPAAKVVFIPTSWSLFRRDALRKLSTRAGADGAFRLTVPRSRAYKAWAVSTGGEVGYVNVPLANAESQEVRIVVAALRYERFEFSDADGRPIPVREFGLLLGHGLPFADSVRPVGIWQHLVLERAGIDLRKPPAANVWYAFYGVPGLTAKVAFNTRPVDIPGYERVDVVVGDEALRSLSEWPAGEHVVLRRKAGAKAKTVSYRVLFPTFSRYGLERWLGESFDLVLIARFQLARHKSMRILTRRAPMFRADGDTQLSISLEGFDPLPYDLEKKGGVILVRPRYPDFAWLRIRRRKGISGTGFGLEGHWPPVDGRIVGDGLVAFGPLPVGSYSVTVETKDVPLRTLGPIQLAPGINEYDWE